MKIQKKIFLFLFVNSLLGGKLNAAMPSTELEKNSIFNSELSDRVSSRSLSSTEAPIAPLSKKLPRCFENHIQEALVSNTERRAKYQKDGGGMSSYILSTRWILIEKIALLAGNNYYKFDQRAEPFQKNGINILCDEFVDMSLTPAYKLDEKDEAPLLEGYVKPNGTEMMAKLSKAYQEQSYKGLFSATLEELKVLNKEPKFNCMVRHLLESLARVTALAPGHERKALALALPSPKSISEDLVKTHIDGIGISIRLDSTASSLQSRGLPIICRDVPPVPIPENPEF